MPEEPVPETEKTPAAAPPEAEPTAEEIAAGAEHPDAVSNAVEKEREKRRKAQQERDAALARIQEFEDRDKTEAQKLADENARLKAEAASVRDENERSKAGLEAGLDPDLFDRIRGETYEDKVEDAKNLAAKFAPPAEEDPEPDSRVRPKPRLRPGAAPSADAEPSSPEELASQVPRRDW